MFFFTYTFGHFYNRGVICSFIHIRWCETKYIFIPYFVSNQYTEIRSLSNVSIIYHNI